MAAILMPCVTLYIVYGSAHTEWKQKSKLAILLTGIKTQLKIYKVYIFTFVTRRVAIVVLALYLQGAPGLQIQFL